MLPLQQLQLSNSFSIFCHFIFYADVSITPSLLISIFHISFIRGQTFCIPSRYSYISSASKAHTLCHPSVACTCSFVTVVTHEYLFSKASIDGQTLRIGVLPTAVWPLWGMFRPPLWSLPLTCRMCLFSHHLHFHDIGRAICTWQQHNCMPWISPVEVDIVVTPNENIHR